MKFREWWKSVSLSSAEIFDKCKLTQTWNWKNCHRSCREYPMFFSSSGRRNLYLRASMFHAAREIEPLRWSIMITKKTDSVKLIFLKSRKEAYLSTDLSLIRLIVFFEILLLSCLSQYLSNILKLKKIDFHFSHLGLLKDQQILLIISCRKANYGGKVAYFFPCPGIFSEAALEPSMCIYLIQLVHIIGCELLRIPVNKRIMKTHFYK